MMIEQQDYLNQYDLDNLAQHIYVFSLGGIQNYPALAALSIKDTDHAKT